MTFEIDRNGFVLVTVGTRSPLYIPQNAFVFADNEVIKIIYQGYLMKSFKRQDVQGDKCNPPLSTSSVTDLLVGLQAYFNPNPNVAINELTQAIRDLIVILTP